MEASPVPQATQASQPRQAHAALSDFTLALIQALLRSGYYASDHPEAQKAITGLYEQFRKLIDGRSELTYMISEKRESQVITVEGYASNPLFLHEFMLKGMADLFTPKFLDFLKRWSLLSFSIKAETTAGDFNTFVDLMSQIPALGAGATASEELTQALADRNILHISTVFKHEMVGRERRLPWRVRLALSRLRRDLRVLPLYKQASADQLSRIKLQIIDDVIRPVRTPDLLKDFLVNYDLIAADISVLEESDVEHEICANLTDGLLVSTGRKILAEIERLSDYGAEAFPWGENVDDVKNRHVSALRDLARTLVTRGSAMEHEFMESLVEQNVLCLDDLPPDLRRAVETHHLTDRFLEGINGYLRYLQNPSGADQARKLAATLYRITPDLVYRAEYGALARVLEVISQGRQRPKVSSFFEQLANYILKALSSDNLLQHQLEALASEEKEQRQSLATIFTFIGDTTIPGLLKVYDSTQDRALRMCIFEVVRAMGGTALRPFLARLKRVESDWAIVRHALSEVGDSGETSLATSCSDFVDHPNPHVRHSALSALFKLVRGQAEQEFIAALSDDDPEVRQTAVSYLGAIGSRHPDALAYYSQVLDPDSEADPEADGVLIETCRAISVVGSSEKQAGLANAILLAALQPVKSKGVFGKLKRSAPRFGEHVLQAVLEALSEVGTREAIPHIEELAAADEALASTAAATIESIKDRSKQTEP